MPQLFKYLLIFITGALLWSVIPKCEGKPIPVTEPLKAKVQAEIKSRDSAKKEVVKTDSARVKTKKKWDAIKSNPGKLPCDSQLVKVVHICDTLITVDSTEIAQLKAVILKDSLIISDYQNIIKSDSAQIQGLKKEVRKERFWKKFFQVITGAALIFGVVK